MQKKALQNERRWFGHFYCVPFALYVFLILAVLAAYAGVFYNAFLWDDNVLILKNKYLLDWDRMIDLLTSPIMQGGGMDGAFYRPLQMLTYAFVYRVAGLSEPAFHALNVALHCANACLVLTLGRRMGFNVWASFFAALIWAVHPIHVEAVAYISATADTLYAFFCFLGVIVLLPDFSRRKVAFALLFFVLALLSKETALVFPLLVMACAYATNERRLDLKTYVFTWPFWAVAGLYVLARFAFADFEGLSLRVQEDVYAQSIFCRIWTFLATLPSYVKLLVWPDILHPQRDFPVFETPWSLQVLAGAALVAFAAAQLFWGRGRRGSPLGWGLVWFFAADLFHSGILIPANGLLMEHWMYLPSAGLFLGAGESLWRFLQSKKARIAAMVAAACLAVPLGGRTYKQNAAWTDTETLCLTIFEGERYLPRAHDMLGAFYSNAGRYAEAIMQFDLAIKKSNDTMPFPHYNAGVALLRMTGGDEDLRAAKAHFERALEIAPDLYAASKGLSIIYAMKNDQDRADFYDRQARESLEKLKKKRFGAGEGKP